MEKEFVPYKQALALKGLELNIPCIKGFYEKEEIFTNADRPYILNDKKSLGELVSCPTYSQAFRWFREKHNLCGYIVPDETTVYNYIIMDINYGEKNDVYFNSMQSKFNTYEEAESACLDKLIEIVKNGVD